MRPDTYQIGGTPKVKKLVDVEISRDGSLFLVQPHTSRAQAWIEQNVSSEALWFGGALVVEHRYILDLAQGMIDAGLTVI